MSSTGLSIFESEDFVQEKMDVKVKIIKAILVKIFCLRILVPIPVAKAIVTHEKARPAPIEAATT